MAELTLETLLDMGMSLEDILFNKEPVQVDVSINTDNLVGAIEASQQDVTKTVKQIQKIITDSNKTNKELLIKALGMVIKQVNVAPVESTVVQREITGLKIIRNKNSNLLEHIKIVRD